MLILKRKTMTNDKIPQGIVHVQEKGWIDENGMKLWLEEVWVMRSGGLQRKPALLLCDQFKSHVTEATKRRVKDLNMPLAVIPGGLTSQLDVSNNKPFKAFMREEWTKWMDVPHHDLTLTGQMK
jgi:hypothetical protein